MWRILRSGHHRGVCFLGLLISSNTPVRVTERFTRPPNRLLVSRHVMISYSSVRFFILAFLPASQHVLQGDENTRDKETSTEVLSPDNGNAGTAHRATPSVYSSRIQRVRE